MSIRDLDKSSDKFIDSIKKAYLHSLKQLDRLYTLGLSERHTRNVIEEIQRTLKDIDEKAYKWSHEVLPEYYKLSIDQADKQVALLGSVPVLQGADYVLHKQAISRAINDTYQDLAARTKLFLN
jgi:RNA binding exosome subunit